MTEGNKLLYRRRWEEEKIQTLSHGAVALNTRKTMFMFLIMTIH